MTAKSEPPKLAFKPTFIMLSSLMFLVILFEYGRLPFYFQHIAPHLPQDHDHELYAHLYLAMSSVVTRMVLPLLCIVFILRAARGADAPWRGRVRRWR